MRCVRRGHNRQRTNVALPPSSSLSGLQSDLTCAVELVCLDTRQRMPLSVLTEKPISEQVRAASTREKIGHQRDRVRGPRTLRQVVPHIHPNEVLRPCHLDPQGQGSTATHRLIALTYELLRPASKAPSHPIHEPSPRRRRYIGLLTTGLQRQWHWIHPWDWKRASGASA